MVHSGAAMAEGGSEFWAGARAVDSAEAGVGTSIIREKMAAMQEFHVGLG